MHCWNPLEFHEGQNVMEALQTATKLTFVLGVLCSTFEEECLGSIYHYFHKNNQFRDQFETVKILNTELYLILKSFSYRLQLAMKILAHLVNLIVFMCLCYQRHRLYDITVPVFMSFKWSYWWKSSHFGEDSASYVVSP
ncbi:hypothetical protein J6590_048211 [Homalodisca vitripennis]|nr:hypothetical protein J6590_048211 [Homalodisca vitripennis]